MTLLRKRSHNVAIGGPRTNVRPKHLETVSPSGRLYNVTDSAFTPNSRDHDGKIITLNRAAGQAVTLPPAIGSGAKLTFVVGTTITSNTTTIKVANSSDTMIGNVHTETTTAGAGLHEAAGGTDDTITMNGTTTGGIAGSTVEVVDIAANLWQINGNLVGSGTLATSLSATV